MKAIAGLIVITGAGLTIAARVAPGETTRASHEQQLVVLPTSMNGDASLQLASHGVAELMTDDGLVLPTLHVRAVIANTARAPWALDAAKARLEGASGPPVAPAAVNSDLPTLPIAIIDPGERLTLDFYFPLPPELAERGGPATFALSWPVQTPARVVRNAWFERAAATVQSQGDVAPAAGWGRDWWFDPRYPWSAYHHRAGVATPLPPDHAIVTRAPRWDEPVSEADGSQPRETECQQW